MNITLNITLDDSTLASLHALLSKGAVTPSVKHVPKNIDRLVNGTWANTFGRMSPGETKVFSNDLRKTASHNAHAWTHRWGKSASLKMVCKKNKDGTLTVKKVAI